MNQTISGTMLLAAVVMIGLILFAIAYLKKPKSAQTTSAALQKSKCAKGTVKPKFNSKSGSFNNKLNPQLAKLKKQVMQNFPDFTTLLRQQHLVLERNAKKVALLTLDANAALGRRRLGDVVVINFHQLPSVEELRIELSGL